MTTSASRVRPAPVDDTKPASANYHVNALARGLALLERLADSDRALTLSDFSQHTSLPKSTLVRLLSVLVEMDYLVRIDDRPAYRLGHKVQRLANAYLSTLDLTLVAKGYLQSVADRTGETANLGVLDGNEVLHVCVAEPDRPLRFTTATGARDQVYCTGLGKLLLSELEPAQVEACLPPEPFPAFTDATFDTLAALRTDLKRTARRGFALDDNERSTGLRCVAVPVRFDGDCLAALSVSGPEGEFGPTARQRFVAELRLAADQLSADPEVETALRLTHRSLRPPATPS